MESEAVKKIRAEIEESIESKKRLLDSGVEDIHRASAILSSALKNGGTVFLCGNGGSAADAQHIAAELLVRFRSGKERRALPALSLAADSSVLTAGGNDYGYDNVFARQLEGLSHSGDALVGITTSGNSENILRAFQTSRSRGGKNILLTGQTGGRIVAEHGELLDAIIRVPAESTARIQESHIMVGHILCLLIEKNLFNLD